MPAAQACSCTPNYVYTVWGHRIRAEGFLLRMRQLERLFELRTPVTRLIGAACVSDRMPPDTDLATAPFGEPSPGG